MVIVLDTNIWVSLAINKQLDFIASLHKKGVKIAACENLLKELITVLSREKFKDKFQGNYIEKFSTFHLATTISFEVQDIEDIVSDKKDNYLFALCKISNADYFITGDKLLLKVFQYQHSSIINLAGFRTKV